MSINKSKDSKSNKSSRVRIQPSTSAMVPISKFSLDSIEVPSSCVSKAPSSAISIDSVEFESKSGLQSALNSRSLNQSHPNSLNDQSLSRSLENVH